MPTIGDVITACQREDGEPEDPDWSTRLLDIEDSDLFIPRNPPHPFAAWEVIEWYARGLSLSRVAKKVGVAPPTVAAWMERIGIPRRPSNCGRSFADEATEGKPPTAPPEVTTTPGSWWGASRMDHSEREGIRGGPSGGKTTIVSALDKLNLVLNDLTKIRNERGWSWSDCGRMLDIHRAHIRCWIARAKKTTTLPLLDAYAREFGYDLRILLLEDNPNVYHGPWRQRMPHGEAPFDKYAMEAIWRLQQQLTEIRLCSGRPRGEIADVLGIPVLELWRLENSPTAVEAALMNTLTLARLFGCHLEFLLEPLNEGGDRRQLVL